MMILNPDVRQRGRVLVGEVLFVYVPIIPNVGTAWLILFANGGGCPERCKPHGGLDYYDKQSRFP
jgi:hypothetical protein